MIDYQLKLTCFDNLSPFINCEDMICYLRTLSLIQLTSWRLKLLYQISWYNSSNLNIRWGYLNLVGVGHTLMICWWSVYRRIHLTLFFPFELKSWRSLWYDTDGQHLDRRARSVCGSAHIASSSRPNPKAQRESHKVRGHDGSKPPLPSISTTVRNTTDKK